MEPGYLFKECTVLWSGCNTWIFIIISIQESVGITNLLVFSMEINQQRLKILTLAFLDIYQQILIRSTFCKYLQRQKTTWFHSTKPTNIMSDLTQWFFYVSKVHIISRECKPECPGTPHMGPTICPSIALVNKKHRTFCLSPSAAWSLIPKNLAWWQGKNHFCTSKTFSHLMLSFMLRKLKAHLQGSTL